MKQVPEPQRLTPDWLSDCSTAWAAQLLGLLAVCRARDRGELPWQLDVRRASASIDAQRAVARAQRARSQEAEGKGPGD
jgi:hypothetical protein